MLNELEKLTKSFDLPKKEFTNLQKEFFKKYWDKYSLELWEDESKLIFVACMDFISDDKTNNESKYNALRLIKLSLLNEKIFGDIYVLIIWLFLYCINHDYWNLRMESIHLLSELSFRTSIYTESYSFSKKKDIIKNKELYNYCYPLLIDLYFKLWDLNDKYEFENKKNIRLKDRKKDWYIQCSYDTEDKYLKNIRRAIEELDTPHLIWKMKEFWFIEK